MGTVDYFQLQVRRGRFVLRDKGPNARHFVAYFAEVPGIGLHTVSVCRARDGPALYYGDVNRKSLGTAGACEMTMI